MKSLVVGSAFRNAAGGQIARWLEQVSALYGHGYEIRAVAAEGDSTDRTRAELLIGAAERGIPLDLRTCNHGGPVYGSIECPNRMSALSKVGNEILSGVNDLDDYLLYVESDLIWEPSTVIAMIDLIDSDQADVVAPMIYAGDLFYDIWAYRKDGVRFNPFPPYHSELNGLTEVDSVGSCLLMKAKVAHECRMINGDALVGFCVDARSKGYMVAVEPSLSVRHPA